ncbi:Riboflavin synthase [Glarea lozoyensis ATCC 20868]|uniref:Riboflavin synthase n=1 Tax=Glarea lozoyensis (strain ATCC 20868 / MF5171) TaxID=1116229 RepID=S3CIJ3_GLAL2|nr:Riboflavin synthase [Glarea lozoyensis ATCC 20868]EPE25655.1 Riboflavin synthase [Glarea lozoyensis ATCC 20868]
MGWAALVKLQLLSSSTHLSTICSLLLPSCAANYTTFNLLKTPGFLFSNSSDILPQNYIPPVEMAFYEVDTQWHDGEKEMRRLLHVPDHDNPTSPMLTTYAASTLQRSPLLALGTLDSKGMPWTTLWGGEPGFSRAIAQQIIGIRATIDRLNDPVAEILFDGKSDGEVVQAEGNGKMVSGLGINLETRSRVKLFGRMVAGSLQSTEEGIGDVQLVVKIEQSLANCPKYLNIKSLVRSLPHPRLVSSELPLSKEALDTIAEADLFFISSSNHASDMDTNHRGGPIGFVRVLENDSKGVSIVYPEYSGNRLYQTLGNLKTTPQAGLAFPNFETGDILYVTGETEILTGKAASSLIAHTNLAVKITIKAARYVSDGLAFRGSPGEYSPYNPPVRYLTTEKQQTVNGSEDQIMVKLIDKQIITPTIARFRFHIPDPKKAGQWKPGQHVALSFEDELDVGYSHMRDDDPQSINDDFMRTFTISSSKPETSSSFDQFDITIRKVGVVTDFLFKSNVRAGLDVRLRGFGGEFYIQQQEAKEISFVGAGVGITPLLAQASNLDLTHLNLYWTVRSSDLALVNHVFYKVPGLAQQTKLYITGQINEDSTELKKIPFTVHIKKRRITKEDLSKDDAAKWYLCTGIGFRNSLTTWLEGKSVSYEDFNY